MAKNCMNRSKEPFPRTMAKGQSLLQELGDGPHSMLYGYTDMEFGTNLRKIGFWVITFTPNNIVHMVIFVDGTMLY